MAWHRQRAHRLLPAVLLYIYVELDENVPDKEAEDAVVLIVSVLLTTAVVPDAVLLKLKVADPTPPDTWSSSLFASSIRISMAMSPHKIHGVVTLVG
jgi:hypothetical protein